MRHKKESDIKAPDGYTLAGVRRVRKDGTVLFNRGWWRAPDESIGEDVWVHEEWRVLELGGEKSLVLEVAPPGLHIYDARYQKVSVICKRTDRRDAKPQFRDPHLKAWMNR